MSEKITKKAYTRLIRSALKNIHTLWENICGPVAQEDMDQMYGLVNKAFDTGRKRYLKQRLNELRTFEQHLHATYDFDFMQAPAGNPVCGCCAVTGPHNLGVICETCHMPVAIPPEPIILLADDIPKKREWLRNHLFDPNHPRWSAREIITSIAESQKENSIMDGETICKIHQLKEDLEKWLLDVQNKSINLVILAYARYLIKYPVQALNTYNTVLLENLIAFKNLINLVFTDYTEPNDNMEKVKKDIANLYQSLEAFFQKYDHEVVQWDHHIYNVILDFPKTSSFNQLRLLYRELNDFYNYLQRKYLNGSILVTDIKYNPVRHSFDVAKACTDAINNLNAYVKAHKNDLDGDTIRQYREITVGTVPSNNHEDFVKKLKTLKEFRDVLFHKYPDFSLDFTPFYALNAEVQTMPDSSNVKISYGNNFHLMLLRKRLRDFIQKIQLPDDVLHYGKILTDRVITDIVEENNALYEDIQQYILMLQTQYPDICPGDAFDIVTECVPDPKADFSQYKPLTPEMEDLLRQFPEAVFTPNPVVSNKLYTDTPLSEETVVLVNPELFPAGPWEKDITTLTYYFSTPLPRPHNGENLAELSKYGAEIYDLVKTHSSTTKEMMMLLYEAQVELAQTLSLPEVSDMDIEQYRPFCTKTLRKGNLKLQIIDVLRVVSALKTLVIRNNRTVIK